MNEQIGKVITELSKLSSVAEEEFGSLSPEQLNWKPDEKSWSVGQCLDHLIIMNRLYFPVFQRLESGNFSPSFWEKYSPLSRLFGGMLIKSMHPDNLKKVKTSPKAQPTASQIDHQIVRHFCECQDTLIAHLQKLPKDINPATTMITSPLLGFVTYTLTDCMTILIVHEQRHFGQAQRVMASDGFPDNGQQD